MKLQKWFTKIAMKILGFFPSELPVGMEAFDTFCTQLFDTYGLPDNPSYRHAVASQIMHLGPTANCKPKRFFAKVILKAMANQIAYYKIQEMKKLEDKFIEETMAKKEVTPNTEPPPGPPIQDQSV